MGSVGSILKLSLLSFLRLSLKVNLSFDSSSKVMESMDEYDESLCCVTVEDNDESEKRKERV